MLTSQTIDDTRTLRFHEKNRRFVNVNPDISSKKIHDAKDITVLRHGVLPEEYDDLVVSRAEKEKARWIAKVIMAKLKHHSKFLGPKRARC